MLFALSESAKRNLFFTHAERDSQGHSKNPTGNDRDRFGTILPEVLAGFGHRKPSGSDQR